MIECIDGNLHGSDSAGEIETALLGAELDFPFDTLPELAALHGCPQTAVFHAEGDVAIHSLMVYEIACEHVERLAPGAHPLTQSTSDALLHGGALRLAALLHDIGKPGTTRSSGPGRWSAHGHDVEGAGLVSSLFFSHPALVNLPLGVYVSVNALVRAHMWAYAGANIAIGAALRMSHVTDPQQLMALWDSDSRGRMCDDAEELARRVAFSARFLEEVDAVRMNSCGQMDQITARSSVDARAWRETFRAMIKGEIQAAETIGSYLAEAEKRPTRGSITYTIGLPDAGKSRWARETWRPASGGKILSYEPHEGNDIAHSLMEAKIIKEIGINRDICMVSTHLTRESRSALIAVAQHYGAELHAVYFPVSISREFTHGPTDHDTATLETKELIRKLHWPTPDEYQTLTVIEPNGQEWDYNNASRWLTASQACAHYPPEDTPWRS